MILEHPRAVFAWYVNNVCGRCAAAEPLVSNDYFPDFGDLSRYKVAAILFRQPKEWDWLLRKMRLHARETFHFSPFLMKVTQDRLKKCGFASMVIEK